MNMRYCQGRDQKYFEVDGPLGLRSPDGPEDPDKV